MKMIVCNQTRSSNLRCNLAVSPCRPVRRREEMSSQQNTLRSRATETIVFSACYHTRQRSGDGREHGRSTSFLYGVVRDAREQRKGEVVWWTG